MDNGWVKLHRKSMESTIWKNPMIWFVWSWCLMKANHKDNKFPFNGKDILVKGGSFITGQIKAQEELPTLTRQNLRTALDYLKSTNRITITSTNKFSLITILNWKQYQQDNHQTNQPLTNEQPTTNQRATTNKNVKKEKNVKNTIQIVSVTLGEFKNVKLTEEEIVNLDEKIGRDRSIALIEELSTYMASKKTSYKSHYATLVSWDRRKKGDIKSNSKKLYVG